MELTIPDLVRRTERGFTPLGEGMGELRERYTGNGTNKKVLSGKNIMILGVHNSAINNIYIINSSNVKTTFYFNLTI